MAGKVEDDHLSPDEIEAFHMNGQEQSNKGCLWRHISDFDEGNHCSHRWQARLKGQDDAHLYNYPAYKSLCLDHKASNKEEDSYETAAYSGPKQNKPSNYAMQHLFPLQLRKRPRPGQWDISLGHNFFENATKPYWHNAHHIIPLSVLQNSIQDAGKNTSGVTEIIKKGLMKGGYNLNHKINMIILPHDRVVAEAIGLPRHLRGHEARGKEPNKRRETDHPDYSRRVKFQIRSVIDDYKQKAEEAKDCEGEPDIPALSKKKLEDISKKIYKTIITAGPHLKGKSLDELKFSNLGSR
ncbi:MAG: AHH domain-containing protein [Gammaproteobacteria bacterium]|nr:AHH domain-containing protein [Gammaproteobacteria bacterium]MDH5728417.1 AHH domain-containing protein [Gammaproteobacteria bacterium]